MQAIEEAIAQRLERVEAGAQGEHKLARGYLPVITHSMHLLRHPVASELVQRFLVREAHDIEHTARALAAMASPYKDRYTEVLAQATSAVVSRVHQHADELAA